MSIGEEREAKLDPDASWRAYPHGYRDLGHAPDCRLAKYIEDRT